MNNPHKSRFPTDQRRRSSSQYARKADFALLSLQVLEESLDEVDDSGRSDSRAGSSSHDDAGGTNGTTGAAAGSTREEDREETGRSKSHSKSEELPVGTSRHAGVTAKKGFGFAKPAKQSSRSSKKKKKTTKIHPNDDDRGGDRDLLSGSGDRSGNGSGSGTGTGTGTGTGDDPQDHGRGGGPGIRRGIDDGIPLTLHIGSGGRRRSSAMSTISAVSAMTALSGITENGDDLFDNAFHDGMARLQAERRRRAGKTTDAEDGDREDDGVAAAQVDTRKAMLSKEKKQNNSFNSNHATYGAIYGISNLAIGGDKEQEDSFSSLENEESYSDLAQVAGGVGVLPALNSSTSGLEGTLGDMDHGNDFLTHSPQQQQRQQQQQGMYNHMGSDGMIDNGELAAGSNGRATESWNIQEADWNVNSTRDSNSRATIASASLVATDNPQSRNFHNNFKNNNNNSNISRGATANAPITVPTDNPFRHNREKNDDSHSRKATTDAPIPVPLDDPLQLVRQCSRSRRDTSNMQVAVPLDNPFQLSRDGNRSRPNAQINVPLEDPLQLLRDSSSNDRSRRNATNNTQIAVPLDDPFQLKRDGRSRSRRDTTNTQITVPTNNTNYNNLGTFLVPTKDPQRDQSNSSGTSRRATTTGVPILVSTDDPLNRNRSRSRRATTDAPILVATENPRHDGGDGNHVSRFDGRDLIVPIDNPRRAAIGNAANMGTGTGPASNESVVVDATTNPRNTALSHASNTGSARNEDVSVHNRQNETLANTADTAAGIKPDSPIPTHTSRSAVPRNRAGTNTAGSADGRAPANDPRAFSRGHSTAENENMIVSTDRQADFGLDYNIVPIRPTRGSLRTELGRDLSASTRTTETSSTIPTSHRSSAAPNRGILRNVDENVADTIVRRTTATPDQIAAALELILQRGEYELTHDIGDDDEFDDVARGDVTVDDEAYDHYFNEESESSLNEESLAQILGKRDSISIARHRGGAARGYQQRQQQHGLNCINDNSDSSMEQDSIPGGLMMGKRDSLSVAKQRGGIPRFQHHQQQRNYDRYDQINDNSESSLDQDSVSLAVMMGKRDSLSVAKQRGVVLSSQQRHEQDGQLDSNNDNSESSLDQDSLSAAILFGKRDSISLAAQRRGGDSSSSPIGRRIGTGTANFNSVPNSIAPSGSTSSFSATSGISFASTLFPANMSNARNNIHRKHNSTFATRHTGDENDSQSSFSEDSIAAAIMCKRDSVTLGLQKGRVPKLRTSFNMGNPYGRKNSINSNSYGSNMRNVGSSSGGIHSQSVRSNSISSNSMPSIVSGGNTSVSNFSTVSNLTCSIASSSTAAQARARERAMMLASRCTIEGNERESDGENNDSESSFSTEALASLMMFKRDSISLKKQHQRAQAQCNSLDRIGDLNNAKDGPDINYSSNANLSSNPNDRRISFTTNTRNQEIHTILQNFLTEIENDNFYNDESDNGANSEEGDEMDVNAVVPTFGAPATASANDSGPLNGRRRSSNDSGKSTKAGNRSRSNSQQYSNKRVSISMSKEKFEQTLKELFGNGVTLDDDVVDAVNEHYDIKEGEEGDEGDYEGTVTERDWDIGTRESDNNMGGQGFDENASISGNHVNANTIED